MPQRFAAPGSPAPIPSTLIAELTHRCPLACTYCSNPTTHSPEIDERAWAKVLDEAAALGILAVHFTGGEPLLRPDLERLVGAADRAGLYASLITSGVGLTRDRLDALVDAGVHHVQLSFQGVRDGEGLRVAGREARAEKRAAIDAVRERGLYLTLNFVTHRENADDVAAMLAFAEACDVDRVELAHAQYHGFAFRERDALLPSREQVDAIARTVTELREPFASRVTLVRPDYFSGYPRACTGGWGSEAIVVAPSGRILPCHGAHALPETDWPTAPRDSLEVAWTSPPFERYRGTGFLGEPCASCERKEIDFGGCRCQAFLLTGDAARTDPACEKSPDHGLVRSAVDRAAEGPRPITLRRRTQ